MRERNTFSLINYTPFLQTEKEIDKKYVCVGSGG